MYIIPIDYYKQKEYYEKKKEAFEARIESLKKCDIILAFCTNSSRVPFNNSIQKAIDRIISRTGRYVDKGSCYDKDCFDFIIQELKTLKQEALKGTTQYECEIAIDIIHQIKQGIDEAVILENIINKYPEKRNSDFPSSTSVLDGIPDNPNWNEEGKQQLKQFDELSKQISIGTVYMPAIHIKLLNSVERYYSVCKKKQVNLFDYLEYELTNKLLSAKRETTKNEYRQALNIVLMLKADISTGEIYDCLKKSKQLR